MKYWESNTLNFSWIVSTAIGDHLIESNFSYVLTMRVIMVSVVKYFAARE